MDSTLMVDLLEIRRIVDCLVNYFLIYLFFII